MPPLGLRTWLAVVFVAASLGSGVLGSLDGSCSIEEVTCNPNSTFAPSWCKYQNVRVCGCPSVLGVRMACRGDSNMSHKRCAVPVLALQPLIVPRPPTALVNASSTDPAGQYERHYICESTDNPGEFERCQLITVVRRRAFMHCSASAAGPRGFTVLVCVHTVQSHGDV